MTILFFCQHPKQLLLDGSTTLTLPCSTKGKYLSTSLLKAVILISPWTQKNVFLAVEADVQCVNQRVNKKRTKKIHRIHNLLTVSSIISKEKSLPSPLELLQLRMLDLLVTRALMVHLDTQQNVVTITWHWKGEC